MVCQLSPLGPRPSSILSQEVESTKKANIEILRATPSMGRLVARNLSDDELSFTVREATNVPADVLELFEVMQPLLDLSSLPRPVVTPHKLFADEVAHLLSARRNRSNAVTPTHLIALNRQRFGTCNLTQAFGKELHSPCLKTPPAAVQWMQLLRNRAVAFIGDSVLRDLFIFICLTVTAHTTKSAGFNFWEHFGTGTGGASFARVDFGRGSRLMFCNHEDDDCIRTSMLSSQAEPVVELAVIGFGAHCAPLTRKCDTIFSGWPFESCSEHTCLQSAGGKLLQRLHEHKRAVIWMEYPAPHFQQGLGEYEDRWVSQRAWARFNRPLADIGALCRPLGSCVSSLTGWRLQLRSHFDKHGVPILRTWDTTANSPEVHPEHSSLGYTSDIHHEKGPDCRHVCNPSSVLRLWAARLYTMLTPAVESDCSHLSHTAYPAASFSRDESASCTSPATTLPRSAQNLHGHERHTVETKCAGKERQRLNQTEPYCACLQRCMATCGSSPQLGHRGAHRSGGLGLGSICIRFCVFHAQSTEKLCPDFEGVEGTLIPVVVSNPLTARESLTAV